MDTQIYVARVKEYMKEKKMAENGDGVLAAVSGGADSVCLLWILKELSVTEKFHLAAFHLNHGLRGEEADRDEAYVKELCEKLNVPLLSVREDIKKYAMEHNLSVEEAGRERRYFHLNRAAEQFQTARIATAHHRDDQVETVLMNLFRGSGLRGLGGIRPVREHVIRPLMCLTREEIEEYLTEHKIAWCEDSTNRELLYSRNKIRNVLVPWVKKEVNERGAEHILAASGLAWEADEYFRAQAERIIEENAEINNGCVKILTNIFDGQPHILKTYVIRAMLRRLSGSEKDISVRHIEAVCGLTGPGGGTTVDLPYGLCAVRGYEFLELEYRNREKKERKFSDLHVKTRIFPWEKSFEIPKNQYTKWFDYDKIETAVCVRGRKSGDYFLCGGGNRKLLKRYFIDEKIPEAQRDEIPLLADGNHIIWVIGYRISEYYKISEDTRTILEVTVCKGEENG